MNEVLVKGTTLPEAYHQALFALLISGEESSCSDWNTNQKELSMTMVVQNPLQEPMISKLFIGGFKELEQYCQEMIDGILDFEVERGNWSYTYHQRMASQMPLMINELRRNSDSRRAVIDVRDWEHDIFSNDPACLQHIQYFIRDNKLHCKVLFRSNDACKATFMNAFALIMIQKKIADQLGIEVGTYTHRANSFHCYERDYELLRGYVNRINSSEDNCTYDYIGEWDELMEASKPEIAQMVEELKHRNEVAE